jgi:hypothetical protein
MMMSGQKLRFPTGSNLSVALVACYLAHAGLSASAETGAAMIAIDVGTQG